MILGIKSENWEHGMSCPASHGVALVRFRHRTTPGPRVDSTFGLTAPFDPPGLVSPSLGVDLTPYSMHSSIKESNQLTQVDAIYGDRSSESAYRQ